MKNTKKENVLNSLLDMADARSLDTGARLPAEREMAGMFKASRATVREVLRLLEEKGLLRVVRGSGAYLTCDSKELRERIRASQEKPVFQMFREHFEVRFLMVANMARIAAIKTDEKSIEQMQQSTVKMSRTVIDRNLSEFVNEESRFFKILTAMTQNSVFNEFMGVAIKKHSQIWQEMIKDNIFPDESIFAGYVNICNALMLGDPEDAYRQVQANVMHTLEWLAEKSGPAYAGIKEHLQIISGADIEG